MDKPLPILTDLLVKHEVLRARLEIRAFFLRNVFREVYENVGQILSLVKMQLQAGGATLIKDKDDPYESAGNLVGRSIDHLRNMCRDFHPDEEILKENGFAPGIQRILQIIDPDTECQLKIREGGKRMEQGIVLIVFNMILEILVSIKKAKGALISLVMGYTKEQFALQLMYTGDSTWLGNQLITEIAMGELTLQQRVQLLKGNLSVLKRSADKNKIKLILPLNQSS
jgi:hypothetical protein